MGLAVWLPHPPRTLLFSVRPLPASPGRRPRTQAAEVLQIRKICPSIPGFHDIVRRSWEEPCQHLEPYQRLFHKLRHTGTNLTKWSRGIFSKAKLHLHAALFVILRLDMAQDCRPLSEGERDLRSRLKRRVIAFAAVERARKKQCARIANIKEGDANTKNFHLRVNARRRKNHIRRLKRSNGCKVEGDGSPRAEERRAVGRRHRGASLSPTSTGRFQWFLSPSITGTSALRPPLPIPQRHHRYASRCCATLIQISLFKVWREWQTDFG